ncbi:dihydrolipoyl dehydrogenase [Desulforhopalus singaporensis]|uniref:Dihydrolipoyl dehydrogenase n=1 Tax=Desulforhopalus singaporensis TaxID=91360 RepID=A0A1H0T260_9BACT|nr:dihydrolipoyl dehydrogenase [Desulforhopalus singaporensis]SDP47648.1 dihydrolipoamide dehydrogenase [Desulforhopalus singaporensis]
MTDQSYDLVVVGGGPGGYVAAIRGAQMGMKTALVEREHLGGICLNWGCIPTKALLRSAEIYRLMKHADEFGMITPDVKIDIDVIVKRSRGVASQLGAGVGYLLQKNGVTVLEGTASLQGGGQLAIAAESGNIIISSTNIILATGARPIRIKGLEPDGELVWTYKEAMVPAKVPGRLLIVGAGAIGIEFASFYSEFGSEVTLVEALPQILPAGDVEISNMLQQELETQGIKISTSTYLESIVKQSSSVDVSLKTSDGEVSQESFDRVLLAMGVVGNSDNIGLENTKAKVEKGFIKVDEWLRTDEPGLFAIGDVAGAPCLAHKASHEGVVCVEKIAGNKSVQPVKSSRIPYCTYSHPQVASIGLTEKQAQERGYKIKVGRFPFVANGKAVALGETAGLIKTIFDADRGELLGAHMIGSEVTEMIQGYGIAMNLETTEEELMHNIFAHPTLSEVMHESVLSAFDKAIHI